MGRLLNAGDDGPNAAGAAVLTYRFWTTSLARDPGVLGKTIRLGRRTATVVGVLEPAVPYPTETELIANVVTSPHHLSATMVTGREHRMTELFGRLAPGADIESARAELRALHAGIVKANPEAYPVKADFRIEATRLRDQITSGARTVLLVLLASAVLVFVIALSNVANLILARTVRREGELAVRAALGASSARLRMALLAEALVLCGAGAALGVAIAGPTVAVLAKYAARFSVRALDLTLDPSVLWVGVALALAASVLLAFVPRLPSADTTHGFALTSGGMRMTGGANRRLRAFAVTQLAASFVLLAGAGMVVKTLLSLQANRPGFETSRVLAVNVPVISFGRTPDQIRQFYREVQRRLSVVPGIDRVAVASGVPWRDAGGGNLGLGFSLEGYQPEDGGDVPRAKFRSVSPGYFSALGIPILAGRDFSDADRLDAEKVVIISQSIAERYFPGQDPLNRRFIWTDGIMKFIGVSQDARRIIGVVPSVDDENIEARRMMIVYHPFEQELGGGRLFIHAGGDPYALVPIVTRTIRELSADQPVSRASTLDDIRAEVLAPNRLNALVFGGFAAVALAISVVGVAGVLAFSVSGRTREFGIRLAVGSEPRRLLAGVLREGAIMALVGVASGGVIGFLLSRLARSYITQVTIPGPVPIAGAAILLLMAAVLASVLPAARAARVDVMQALRSE
jgi:predicted permease